MRTFIISRADYNAVEQAYGIPPRTRDIAFATQLPLNAQGIAERIRYCNGYRKATTRKWVIDQMIYIGQTELHILELLGLADDEKRIAYRMLLKIPHQLILEVQNEMEIIGRVRLPYRVRIVENAPICPE